MPCYDSRDREHSERNAKDLVKLKLNYAFVEAALCAALKALELAHAGYKCESLDMINYEQAGILKTDLVKWQKEHAAKDAAKGE